MLVRRSSEQFIVVLALLGVAAPALCAAPADSPEARAAAQAESGDHVEAARLYLEALGEHQKQLQERPDDGAAVRAWASCRNRFAEQQVELIQLREAKKGLTDTQGTLQPFVARHPDDAAAQRELSRTSELLGLSAARAGLNTEAVGHFLQAVAVLRQSATRADAPAEQRIDFVRLLVNCAGWQMHLARYKDAGATYEEAEALARKVMADHPDQPEAVRSLALACNSHALLVRESGQFRRAADMIREAIRLESTLESRYPKQPALWSDLPTYYRNLSQPLAFLHDANESTIARREAQRLDTKLAAFPEAARKWHRDDRKIFNAAAVLDLTSLGQMPTEVGRFRETAAADVQRHPDVPLFRLRLCMALNAEAARLMAETSPADEVLPLYRDSLRHIDQLAEQFPEAPTYRQLASMQRLILGGLCLAFGKTAEGEKLVEEGIALGRKVADEHPGEPSLRYQLTNGVVTVVMTCMAQRDWTRALSLAAISHEEMKKLAETFPECPQYRRFLADSFATVARLRQATGSEEGVESGYRAGIAAWRQNVADFPDNPEFQKSLGGSLVVLSKYLISQGRYADVLPLEEERLRLAERLVRSFPDDLEYRVELGQAQGNYAALLDHAGQADAALAQHVLSARTIEEAFRANPRRREWLESLQQEHMARASLCLKLGRHDEYEAALAVAKELGEQLQSPLLRLYRIKTRLAEGGQVKALQEADDLFANCDMSAQEWYDLAAVYAQAGGAKTPEAEEHARRAVAALRHSAEMGHTPATAIDADPQFHALAERADFREVVALRKK
jgi:tetratricopeptide (TPR) repeat protein